MEYLYLGKFVNTHGIKGEIRILSDFNHKSDVFKKGNFLYIGNEKEKQVINTYRVHKNYDMVTFNGINDINDVLRFKGKSVYINREEFNFEGIIYDDLIGLQVYDKDKLIGEVVDIMKSSAHPLLVIENNGKQNFIPFIDEFILNVDEKNKRIDVLLIEGLINEN